MLKLTIAEVVELRQLTNAAKELLESRKFAHEHRLRVGDTGVTVDVPAEIVLAGIDEKLRAVLDSIKAIGVEVDLPGLSEAFPPAPAPAEPPAAPPPEPAADKASEAAPARDKQASKSKP